MEYSKADCIHSLAVYRRKHGKSPTLNQWRKDNLRPSLTVFRRIFGSWNAGKRAAGLEVYSNYADVEENYFHKINTSTKAYWLGFIYGDGCLEDTRGYNLMIVLGRKDEKHLEKFLESISPDRNISRSSPKGRMNGDTSRVNIGNQALGEDLISHGITPNHKSTTPEIASQYRSDFLRGQFDADGCITCDANSLYQWSISSKSIDRLEHYLEWLVELNITDPYINIQKMRGYDFGHLRVTNKSGICDLYESMWNSDPSSCVCLTRKGRTMTEAHKRSI